MQIKIFQDSSSSIKVAVTQKINDRLEQIYKHREHK